MKIKAIFFLLTLITLSNFSFSSVEEGDIPYEHLGRSSQGEKINFNDYRGKVVIITFWATWCGPCMKELPILGGIQKRVSTDNLQVIAISYKENKKIFKKVAKALAEHPIILSYDRRGSVAKKYGVKAIPHMVIVGRDGVVRSKHIGYSNEQVTQLVDEINALLLEAN